MKTSTIQAAIAVNTGIVQLYQEVVASLRASARWAFDAGDIEDGVEDVKLLAKNRATLAKAVKLQKELKTEMAHNHRMARIQIKKVKLYGPAIITPSITSVELEQALDESLKLKFPAKADTRPADHPSFVKAKKVV